MFTQWNGLAEAVTGDMNIVAEFTILQYTVTIVSNNTEYGNVDVSTLIVNHGTSIRTAANVLTVGSSTSTATPTPSTAQYTYAFDSWSGVPASGTVTEDITVTANFTRAVNQYTVTITVNDPAFGSVDLSSVTVDYGTAISAADNVLTVGSSTSTATPAAFTVFDSWSGVPTSGTVTEDITVTAVFAAGSFAVDGIRYTGTGGYNLVVAGLDGTPPAFTLVSAVDYAAISWTVTGIAADAFSGVTLKDHDNPITPAIGQHFVLYDGIYWLDGWHPNPNYIAGGAALLAIPLIIIVCILIGAMAFVRPNY